MNESLIKLWNKELEPLLKRKLRLERLLRENQEKIDRLKGNIRRVG